MKSCNNCIRSRVPQKKNHCMTMREKPKELFCHMTEKQAIEAEAAIARYETVTKGMQK